MQDQSAKMAVLQQIIDLFTDKQLGGLKKKGQPDVTAISVKADPTDGPAGLLDDAKSADADKEPDGDEDTDSLRKLMEMYAKDEDDEKTNALAKLK